MKKKMTIRMIIVCAITGLFLAFKPRHEASVYCQKQCTNKILFIVDNTGISKITDPCQNGIGGEYFKDGTDVCSEYPSYIKFTPVP